MSVFDLSVSIALGVGLATGAVLLVGCLGVLLANVMKAAQR
jgi:hypothetical protein